MARLTASPTVLELEARTRLAWRPAWAMRNRQGSIALIMALWRRWAGRRWP